MKIAFLGSRGIPRCYSGFETFVEEVSVRLVAMGHQVTVYNRLPFNTYNAAEFKGVKIIRIPTLQGKGTDTLVHSALCTLHALSQNYDIIYVCGVGSSIFSLPAKLLGAKTLVNVDGADWERAKWGAIGKTWLRWSEWLAAKCSDCVVADHPAIQERYRRNFGIDCALIGYGADVIEKDPGRSELERFGLGPKQYLLYVSRLTPENQALLVMEAYLLSGSKLPLIIVGDAPYVSEYQQKLKTLAAAHPERIRMLGYQFGETYRQLSFHARAFFFPTSIDATRPVLLEQMGMGACVIAKDTPANRHVLGEAAIWFSQENSEQALAAAIQMAEKEDSSLRSETARSRIREHYNWDQVTEAYRKLFRRLLGQTVDPALPEGG